MKVCPECEGEGTTFYSCCGQDMRGSDVWMCPECHEHLGGPEECEECKGTGEVEDDTQ